MLMPRRAMIAAGGYGLPAEIAFLSAARNTADTTTYTFTSVGIGAADAERTIIVAVSATAQVQTVSSVTVAGVSATMAARYSGTLNDSVEIWYAAVPTGTSGNIVVTWGGIGQDGCGIGVYRALRVGAVHDSGGTDGTVASPPSVSLDVPAGGIAVACTVHRHGAAGVTLTWAGLTEDYDATGISAAGDDTHSGASLASASGSPGLTVTATPSGNGIRAVRMVACSFAKA